MLVVFIALNLRLKWPLTFIALRSLLFVVHVRQLFCFDSSVFYWCMLINDVRREKVHIINHASTSLHSNVYRIYKQYAFLSC